MRKYYDKAVALIVRGKNKTNNQNRTEVEQARYIAKSLGEFTAARYLAKRGWSLDASLWLLLGVSQRHEQLAPGAA